MTSTDQEIRRAAFVWLVRVLAIFLILACVGLLMRSGQATLVDLGPERFYSLMTLHGLGMVAIMFGGALIAVWYVLAKELKVAAILPGIWIIHALVLIALVGVIIATIFGFFATGWYLLYPLPFVNASWSPWASGLALGSLLVLGIAWALFLLLLLFSLSRTYGFRNLFGWQYFRTHEPAVEIPPIVLITTISVVAGLIAIVSGALFLVFSLVHWGTEETTFDPLMMKNLVFLFGHTIVNITMYLGIAAVYHWMPEYSKRAWPTNRIVALSWNAALVFVLFAYFHHVYMDYVQPETLQYLGQIASYASAVPATVVTVFGAIGQIYGSGMRWSFVPLSFLLGLMGWVIGGFAAVVDSTIAVNVAFHNTMWVPAHFHTYFLMGYLLILLGFIYKFMAALSETLAKTALAAMVTGGYGFVVTLYLSGVLAVPRRYASYEAVPIESLLNAATATAKFGAAFIAVLLFGFVLYLASLVSAPRQKH